MKLLNLLFLGLLLIHSTISYACSSCGTGGSSPLVLYPNESHKALVGYSRESSILDLGPDGEIETSRYASIDRLIVAGGLRLHHRVQTSLSIPYRTNWADDGRHFSDLSDPTLAARWTVLRQNFAAKNIPQVQILASFTPSISRSVNEQERLDGLDVVGSGYNQWTFGQDTWWGMEKFKYGFLSVLTYAEPQDISGTEVQKGLKTDLGGTLGYQIADEHLATCGVSASYTNRSLVDGKLIEGSAAQRGDFFIAHRFKPKPEDEWRLALRQNGFLFRNFNTVRQTMLSMTYARVF